MVPSPALLLTLPGLLACKKVEEIPADLDGVMHYLWQELEDGEEPTLGAGVQNLHTALGGDALQEATDGSISRLSADEVEPLGVTDRDPADAAGIFLGNVIHCALPTVVEIFTWPDQAGLYEGVYESYTRTYDGDLDAFLDGETDVLTFQIDYESKVLGSSYTAHTLAYVRRVSAAAAVEEGLLDEGQAAFAEAYLARFHAPEPAQFEEGSNKTFEQDYQLEIYWDRGAAETLHAYAMWRQADWGSGFTSEDEGVQRLLLNGMEDWDKDTDRICAEGGP